MSRLVAGLVATAMTALVMLGGVALAALCLGLGWVIARAGISSGFVIGAAGAAVVAGLWWSCYRDALVRQRGGTRA